MYLLHSFRFLAFLEHCPPATLLNVSAHWFFSHPVFLSSILTYHIDEACAHLHWSTFTTCPPPPFFLEAVSHCNDILRVGSLTCCGIRRHSVALYNLQDFPLSSAYAGPFSEPYEFGTHIQVTFLKNYFNIIRECMYVCSKRSLSYETLSRNPIYVLSVPSTCYMLHALPISSYSSEHPNNFRNEQKLMALITLHYSPASGFFSFLGPNAFRRTADVNDNLKAMVITKKNQ